MSNGFIWGPCLPPSSWHLTSTHGCGKTKSLVQMTFFGAVTQTSRNLVKKPRELLVCSCCAVVRSLPWSLENGLSCRSRKPGRRLARSRKSASDVWLRARTNGPNWPLSMGSSASEWMHLRRRASVAVWPPTWEHEQLLTALYAALPSITAPQADHTRKSGSGVWTSAFSTNASQGCQIQTSLRYHQSCLTRQYRAECGSPQ